MRRNSIVAAALVVACNCESAQTPPAVSPVAVEQQAQRVDQVVEAANLQESIALGRLIEARERATILAARSADPSVANAARAVASADDLPAMAMALGDLGRAYAALHATGSAAVARPPIEELATANTFEARMQRHQWAARRLWEGLILPDAGRWQSGARVLVTLDIDVVPLMHEKPTVEVVEMAERMRAQAERALTVEGTDARAHLYGEMLQTCASCHAIVRPVPVVTEAQYR